TAPGRRHPDRPASPGWRARMSVHIAIERRVSVSATQPDGTPQPTSRAGQPTAPHPRRHAATGQSRRAAADGTAAPTARRNRPTAPAVVDRAARPAAPIGAPRAVAVRETGATEGP